MLKVVLKLLNVDDVDKVVCVARLNGVAEWHGCSARLNGADE